MDYFKKYRFALVMIVILVVLNLITVTFILLSPLGPGFFMPRERIQSTIEDELQFTDLQKQEYAALRSEHFARGDTMAAIQFNTMDSLFAILGADSVDSAMVKRQAEILGNIETMRSVGLFEHFRSVRALCTPEQQRKFDDVMGKVMLMIRDPRGGPGPQRGPSPRAGSGGPN